MLASFKAHRLADQENGRKEMHAMFLEVC